MSDTTNGNGQVVDRRRVLVCLAAALAVHGALLVAFALGLGAGGTPVLPPVTIDLQATGLGSDLTAPSGGAGAGPAAAQAGAAGAPAGAPAAPAAAIPAGPAVPAAGKGAASSGGFVIPTPRAQPAETTPSSGSAFREAGGKTGVVKGIPSVPGPSTAPVVAPVKQGSGSGTSSSSGAGASAVQRSGTGVVVPGPAGSADGPLDLSKLPKAFPSGGAGSGGQRAGGSGGNGSGGAAAGSGGGGGGGGSGAGQGINVGWGSSEAGRGRALVFSTKPKIPKSVSQQGLMLFVKVRFTVLPHGEISAVSIEKSSGSAEVDASVIEAIHMWLFSPAPDAAPAEGTISYQIDTR